MEAATQILDSERIKDNDKHREQDNLQIGQQSKFNPKDLQPWKIDEALVRLSDPDIIVWKDTLEFLLQ